LARAPKSANDSGPGGGGARPILTIGHSTHPIEQFVELLRQHGVEHLVDIRTIPRSRHNPQFNSEALAKAVRREGIDYAHIKELGGLRHARSDSINTGWRNASFRGYADYMQTGEFDEAVGRLLQLCAEKRCAVMCAEAVPWRCHRSLLADALVARGIAVEHILSRSRRDAHTLTPFAQIENGKVTYPEAKPEAKNEARRKKPATAQAELKFDESEAAMPSKKRKTKFTAAKEARRRARLAAGSPPAERVIADKRRKPAKHKKPLQELRENPE
jgi:hypothetical protein